MLAGFEIPASGLAHARLSRFSINNEVRVRICLMIRMT